MNLHPGSIFNISSIELFNDVFKLAILKKYFDLQPKQRIAKIPNREETLFLEIVIFFNCF